MLQIQKKKEKNINEMSHSCELLYIIRIFNYEVFLHIYISDSLLENFLLIVLMS